MTGVDIEAEGIAHAERQASARGLADRVTFAMLDCSRRLPFDDEAFDVVVCIDAVLHLKDRLAALADWARLLRRGGRLVFTDAAVLTGAVSMEELDIRASQGTFLLAPSGLNEQAVEAAGLILRRCEDRTEATADIAARWHAARDRNADDLLKQEGVEWFQQRQRFLATTADLAKSRRVSRFLYVAEKPIAPLT
jgi:SAM-dependent methyltransferase